jgi:ABC-type branched-subunit amino acid transport system ATPase component
MTDPILEVRGLKKSFGGIVAAKGLSLTLQPNRITGLVGPNGAGKTTFFNMVGGFIRPDVGEVLFESRIISGKAPYEIARLGIGRSFQDVRAFSHLSVLDNVLSAIPDQPGESAAEGLFRPFKVAAATRANREHARQHLDFVKLAHLEHKMAENLSYGQQKRLVLARLLAMGARLLLLDEPASGLDPSALGDMLDVIRATVALGKTICLIEHNLDVVEALSDWLVFMDQGTVVAEGLPREVLERTDLADLYFGVRRGGGGSRATLPEVETRRDVRSTPRSELGS